MKHETDLQCKTVTFSAAKLGLLQIYIQTVCRRQQRWIRAQVDKTKGSTCNQKCKFGTGRRDLQTNWTGNGIHKQAKNLRRGVQQKLETSLRNDSSENSQASTKALKSSHHVDLGRERGCSVWCSFNRLMTSSALRCSWETWPRLYVISVLIWTRWVPPKYFLWLLRILGM